MIRFEVATSLRRLLGGLLLAAALVVVAGCDSAGDEANAEATLVFGIVTDDAGVGKLNGVVAGARVTAEVVSAAGSTRSLDAEATSDSQGRFTLPIDPPDARAYLLLTAEKDGFRTQALVALDDRPRFYAMPMTAESRAEAAIYLALLGQAFSPTGRLSAADVAALVDTRLALAIDAGTTTPDAVATALHTAAAAEFGFLDDKAGSYSAETLTQAKFDAFVRMQERLYFSNVSDDAEALENNLRVDLVRAYRDAGVEAQVQAQARQLGRAALLRFLPATTAEARFGVRKQAALLEAQATTIAISELFQLAEAARDPRALVTEARNALISALRGAAGEASIDAAWTAYQGTVLTALAAETGTSLMVLTETEPAIEAARATLDDALETATSAEAVIEAYVTFRATVQSLVAGIFAPSGNAALGANVMTLLAATL